jgi:ribose transport system ATP-binding protein
VFHRLDVEHLTVAFAETRALDDVSVSFATGEVHALLGPNGSGKSTLVKALSGVVSPRPGAVVTFDGGRPLPALTPERAQRAGLRFVHQDLALLPELPVLENVFLTNRYPVVAGVVRWREARRVAREALAAVGLDVSLSQPVALLPPAGRVLLATARALLGLPDGGLVFVDEPTAALDENDAEVLLSRLRDLARGGDVGIVLITHRLREVLRFADRATVLRDGRVALRAERPELDEATLLAALGGRTPSASQGGPGRPPVGTVPFLEIRRLSGVRLHGFTATVATGEVLGVTGVEGSGKEELVALLYGLERALGGEVLLEGQPYRPSGERDALRAGFGLVPSDRRVLGAITELSVTDNLVLPRYQHFTRWRCFRPRAARREAARCTELYGVRPTDPDRLFATLSGGNQQKVVVGRWLAHERRVLLLHEPTAGVDVASRAALYDHVRAATRKGLAVVLVSSDPTELVELADKVAVLVDGRLHELLAGSDLTVQRVVQSSFEASEEREPA